MSTTSVDGLVSGLNTTDLINKLLDAERAPQLALQQKQSQLNTVIQALQALNTKVKSLGDAAHALSPVSILDTTAWQSVQATSSDSSRVTASVTSGAPAGSYSFTVNQLAQAGSVVSSGTTAATSDVVTSATSLVLTKGSTSTTVSLSGGTLADVVSAINNAKAGVTAAAVQTATGAYRLQVTSTTTGASSTITLTDGSGADPFSGSGLTGMQTLTTGQDATLQVGGASGYTVTRSTNTVSDLFPGLTLNLLKADPATTVTVDVSADSGAVADAVQKMVDAANAVLGQVHSDTAYDATSKKAGVLLGDPLPTNLQREVVSAATDGVAGSTLGSPGLAGLSVTRDGTLKFDRQKFLDAYAKDPADVQALFGANGVGGRIAAVADAATDITSGTLTTSINNRQSQVSDLSKQISDWDVRLADRQRALRQQFTAMEVALGQMRQQSQWLAGQIAGLPTP